MGSLYDLWSRTQGEMPDADAPLLLKAGNQTATISQEDLLQWIRIAEPGAELNTSMGILRCLPGDRFELVGNTVGDVGQALSPQASMQKSAQSRGPSFGEALLGMYEQKAARNRI